MNSKVKEILEYISQATMSINNVRIKPRHEEKVTYKHSRSGEDTINGNITLFLYDIPPKETTDKRFSVDIYKIQRKKFWGNEKYITKVTISNPPDRYSPYSNKNLETIQYCSWLDEDTLQIQKSMFEYLELKNREAEITEENKKYEDYIKDIKKTINVSVSRNNKLNDILENESQR